VNVRRALVVVSAWFGVIAIAGIALGRAVTGPLDTVVARDIDTPVRAFVTRQNDPTWHHLFAHVSAFGTAFVTGMVAIVGGGLWSLRSRNPTIALQCATAFAGAGLLTIIVKFGVDRNPASGPLPAFAAGTFPSGHALFAVSVYGTVGALILRSSGRRTIRAAAAILLAVLALAVGWSRVFLLDHYASDVAASLVLGVAWVAIVVSVIGVRRDARTACATTTGGDKTRSRALTSNPSN
jgi:membrane-associated phospholipid phosphatase